MRYSSFVLCLLLLSTTACHKSQDVNVVGTLTAGVGCEVLLINISPALTVQPVNLNDFPSTVTAKAGQRVLFSYTPDPEDASVCMAGPVVTLTSIRNY